MGSSKFVSVDGYIDNFNGETKKRLIVVRKLILDLIPDVEERISYNIPAYFLNSKMVIYFAGYSQHISVYPIQGDEQRDLVGQWLSGKATAKFPNSKDLPIELIKQLIRLRLGS